MSALRRLGTKLARLFGSRDPSAKWTRDPNLEIVLDLDAGTFCGVAFGEPIERLRGLGKCEVYSEMGAIVCGDEACDVSHLDDSVSLIMHYDSQGFTINATTDLKFEYLSLDVDSSESTEHSYAHRVRLNAHTYHLPPTMNCATVRALFGKPFHQHDAIDLTDTEDFRPEEMKARIPTVPKEYRYEFGDIEVVFQFNREDLACMFLVLPKKMTDANV